MTEPLAEPQSSSFLDSLGERGRRRAEPRTSIALAGAGCALGILGVLIVAGDTGLGDDGDFNKFPGLVLSALVVAAGYFVLAQAKRGAVATGGTVAAALGVPPFMLFLTFSEDKFPPYSTEGILIVSTLVWLASYAIGPGRGRPFFLGAGLIGLWLTVLQVIEKVFTAPFEAIDGFFGGGFGPSANSLDLDTGDTIETGGSFGGEPSIPDPATIGILSLAFGIAFLIIGRRLDRRGHHGVATPFALAALPCLFVGVLGLSPDLEAAGTGLLMVLIGLGLAYHGATVWRRATTWIGGGVTAVGLGVFLTDMTDDATIGGMLFIAAGIGLVFAAHAVASAINEPDEMTVTYALVPVGAVAPTMAAEAPVMPQASPATDELPWSPPPTPPTAPIPPPPGAPERNDSDPPIPPPPPA